MTDSKLFIDTPPVIYLIEKNPKYYEKVLLFLSDTIKNDIELITTVLTTAEFEIKPKKENDSDLIKQFEKITIPLFDFTL